MEKAVVSNSGWQFTDHSKINIALLMAQLTNLFTEPLRKETWVDEMKAVKPQS